MCPNLLRVRYRVAQGHGLHTASPLGREVACGPANTSNFQMSPRISAGTSPLTPEHELRPSPPADRRPIVYGYLSTEDPDEIELAAQKAEIELFCKEQGFRLETVIIDRYVPDVLVIRTGFTGLIDVLELDSSHGVVTLHLDQISCSSTARAVLLDRIRHTSSKLIVIHDE